MTDTEQAVAWLRETFVEGWNLSVRDNEAGWLASALRRDLVPGVRQSVYVTGWGPDPMSAARACVEAWREANPSIMRERAEVAALEVHAQLKAERAHADRLAEGLNKLRSALMGIRDAKPGPKFAFMDREIAWSGEMLAAHDARRSGGGGEGA